MVEKVFHQECLICDAYDSRSNALPIIVPAPTCKAVPLGREWTESSSSKPDKWHTKVNLYQDCPCKATDLGLSIH